MATAKSNTYPGVKPGKLFLCVIVKSETCLSAATLYTQVLFHAAGAAQQSSQGKIRCYTISPRTLREIIDKTLK
jgi:hypothetical protein